MNKYINYPVSSWIILVKIIIQGKGDFWYDAEFGWPVKASVINTFRA